MSKKAMLTDDEMRALFALLKQQLPGWNIWFSAYYVYATYSANGVEVQATYDAIWHRPVYRVRKTGIPSTEIGEWSSQLYLALRILGDELNAIWVATAEARDFVWQLSRNADPNP
jgi:hypothetical protein